MLTTEDYETKASNLWRSKD